MGTPQPRRGPTRAAKALGGRPARERRFTSAAWTIHAVPRGPKEPMQAPPGMRYARERAGVPPRTRSLLPWTLVAFSLSISANTSRLLVCIRLGDVPLQPPAPGVLRSPGGGRQAEEVGLRRVPAEAGEDLLRDAQEPSAVDPAWDSRIATGQHATWFGVCAPAIPSKQQETDHTQHHTADQGW